MSDIRQKSATSLLRVGCRDVLPAKKGSSMRKLLLATAATLAIATPAQARDGSGYVGIDGGILFPRSQNGVFTSTFTQSAQSPAAGTAAPAPGTGLVGALPATLTTVPGPVTGSSRVK